MNNKLQKNKTLSLGRLASLSTIKENLRVKATFQKNELPTPSSEVLLFPAKQPDVNAYADHSEGDTDSPPLLFSAISSYKPDSNTNGTSQSSNNSDHADGGTASPLSSLNGRTIVTNRLPLQPVAAGNFKREDEQEMVFSEELRNYSEEPLDRSKRSGGLEATDDKFVVRRDGEDFDRPEPLRLQLSGISEQDIEDQDDEYWSVPPKVSGLALDRRDLSTGDKWVYRHPDLIRVKGYHPFTAEPPLTTLMHFGFLTPTSLHFVHNHGPVPHASWDLWTVEISGDFLTAPKRLSMRDILLFPPARLPVTLMSSGNRGKELSRAGSFPAIEGLHWGPGAVGTSVWGGARLRDVLRHCGALQSMRGKRYSVTFFGADRYATSIPLEVAADESRDVLLAYEQNLDLLTPDHGFPVTVIVPGFTAGRNVKWLVKIHISAAECDNSFHHLENRMLPSHVGDMQTAISEGWLTRPEFLITDMNLTSVISSPAHNSNILSRGPSNPMKDYVIKGYAYSGGGKKVSRVELSLDGGKTWMLCKIDQPERPTKHGKYWCWCFWELEVELDDLSMSAEIIVRAWDSAMNTQPEFFAWNLLGTMNNCWYRVKIQHDHPIDEDEPPTMTFEHPTQPGSIQGGWLQEPGPGQDLMRTMSIKFKHSESSSSLDRYDNSPTTPRPWRI